MGVLNVTPDSFSDGGRYAAPAAAVARALQMVAEGADIIDVGGESTRPGSLPVEAGLEIDRVLPVIEQLKSKTGALISVDTRKSSVAEAALAAGAHVINDISALEADEGMAATARKYKAGLILMHMQGDPRNMQADPRYGNVVREVRDYLRGRIRAAAVGGIESGTIAVDPGIGFGKTVEHNLRLIALIGKLKVLKKPVVIGLSRKSFLGKITGRAVNERLAASLAALAWCVLNGVSVIRAHAVRESRDVLSVLNAILKEKREC